MIALELDMDDILDGLDEEMEGVEKRLGNLNAVTVPVLQEMQSQNIKRMKFYLAHKKSLSGFIAPASWFIGSTEPRYTKGLWISRPEWVFDIVLDYIMTGEVRRSKHG